MKNKSCIDVYEDRRDWMRKNALKGFHFILRVPTTFSLHNNDFKM